jgi:AbrB family looped-hinge helix DNA binding protein
MPAVKVLPKGQITLPKEVRESMGIAVGDTLVLEKAEGKVLLKKGKTLFDYVGALPRLGLSIEEMREKAVEKAAKDRG